MTYIITRRADPETWEEIERDFKPIDVSERDRAMKSVGNDGLIRIEQVRVREVRVIAADQNSIKTLCWRIGAATGEDAITVPCEGATDMAQVHDIFQKHVEETYPQYLAQRAARKPDRDHRFMEGIIQRADENVKRALGLSTYGPGGFTQRG